MSFWHGRKLVELITDPSSKELSMSRFLLPWMLLLDAAWAYAAVKGWPPKEALGPVSSMLGLCTGAVCGIYGLNSVGGAIGAGFAAWQWRDESQSIRPRAKPAPPQGE